MNTGTETRFNVHKQIPVNDQIVQNPTTPHHIRRPTCARQYVRCNLCIATCARQHVLDNMCNATCARQHVLDNM